LALLKRSIGILAAALALLSAGPARAQQAATPLTFQAALELATAQNPEVAAVRRGRAVREAEVKTAGQWANPELSAEITRDVPHGDLTIGYPIDLGGTRSRRIAVARKEASLADVDEKAALSSLRRNVRMAFYGLVAADEGVALADTVLKLAERVREAAQARFDEGAAPRLEAMEANLGVARAQAELAIAQSNRRSAQAEMNALLNRPAGMELKLEGDLRDIPALPTFERATALALANNIELLTVNHESGIEDLRLSLLKAERVPTPVFSFGTALNAPGEFNVGPHAGVSVSLPIFSRNQGEIAGSLAKSDEIKARRLAVTRRVEARVFSAVERATALRAQAQVYSKSIVPTATSLQSLAEESYRIGRTSILAALDAQRSLRDVKFEFLQALLSLQSAVADLEDILGGPIQ
jgi:cobalt-zinc-cadmium efflux system outer membrane protein